MLVCSGRGHVVCVYRRHEIKTRGINEEGTWLLRRDTQSNHRRPYRLLFVLQGHNAVKGLVGTRDLSKEGRMWGDCYTDLYACLIAASLLVEDAVFTSARVAIHDGDNQVALEMLVE